MNKKRYQKRKKNFWKIKKKNHAFFLYQNKNKINFKIKNILFLLYFREEEIIKELIKIIIKKTK